MPPRINSPCLRAGIESSSRALLQKKSPQSAPACPFSTTAAQQSRVDRRKMQQWLQKYGERFANVDGGYLGTKAQPFPQNPAFRNLPVLGEDARRLIWEKVMVKGESIKAVSAELGVDMRRVGAVVRLQQVEKAWVAQGKPLARPYARAVLAMLPQTHYAPGESWRPHEPINEIHVHGYTMQQLFQPVSESRQFTRRDAARAFHPHMLPADKRVPHPELIERERDMLRGHTFIEAQARFTEAARRSEQELADREAHKAEEAAARVTAVRNDRFEFRFTDVDVDDAGRDGRSRKGTGWRYGMPYYDRKKGQVKIPTSVG